MTCDSGIPFTTGGGKTVNVRVQRADNPSVKVIRVWGVHERVNVNRETAEDEAMTAPYRSPSSPPSLSLGTLKCQPVTPDRSRCLGPVERLIP